MPPNTALLAHDSYADGTTPAEGIVRRVLDRVQPGSIILRQPRYSRRMTPRRAIPMLVDGLRPRRIRVATLGDLLTHAR